MEAVEKMNHNDLKTVRDNDQDDEVDIFADAGFLFDSCQPTKQVTYTFTPSYSPANNAPDDENAREGMPTIRISLECIDDDPGAVQSGHYVWPASPALAQYLVDTYCCSTSNDTTVGVSKIIELGCGCGLVGLCAYKIFTNSRDLVFTDHDPGTLKRAKSNFEASKEVGRPTTVFFEELKWCDDAAYFRDLFRKVSTSDVDNDIRDKQNEIGFDLVVGSDLIYCVEVVKPLIQTVSRLLSKTKKSSKMILSQSFVYDVKTEREIDDVCNELNLLRSIVSCTLSKNGGGEGGGARIQTFTYNQ